MSIRQGARRSSQNRPIHQKFFWLVISIYCLSIMLAGGLSFVLAFKLLVGLKFFKKRL
jgi:hypothetical protein